VADGSIRAHGLGQAGGSEGVGRGVDGRVGSGRSRDRVQRATALEHGSGSGSLGGSRSGFGGGSRGSLGTGSALGTVAARTAITFRTRATVGTVAARTAIAFRTRATVGTVAAIFAIAFRAGTAITAIVAVFTIAFGARAAVVAIVAILTIGTGQVAEAVLEFGGKAALLTNDGVADFAEDGLDLEEHVHQHAECGGLEN